MNRMKRAHRWLEFIGQSDFWHKLSAEYAELSSMPDFELILSDFRHLKFGKLKKNCFKEINTHRVHMVRMFQISWRVVCDIQFYPTSFD